MAIGITIRFDEDSAAPVRRMQRILADKGISDYGDRLGYPPHLTLVSTEGVSVGALSAAAEEFAEGLSCPSLWLEALSLFVVPSPVVWLAPAASAGLLAAHERLVTRLEPEAVHRHYRPGAWTPHVTLAAEVDVRGAVEALRVLAEDFAPVRVVPAAVEVVSYPPARVEWSKAVSPT